MSRIAQSLSHDKWLYKYHTLSTPKYKKMITILLIASNYPKDNKRFVKIESNSRKNT